MCGVLAITTQIGNMSITSGQSAFFQLIIWLVLLPATALLAHEWMTQRLFMSYYCSCNGGMAPRRPHLVRTRLRRWSGQPLRPPSKSWGTPLTWPSGRALVSPSTSSSWSSPGSSRPCQTRGSEPRWIGWNAGETQVLLELPSVKTCYIVYVN